MSTEWSFNGRAGAYVMARVCDLCGLRRELVTKDGRPMAWTRKLVNPPGWTRVEEVEVSTPDPTRLAGNALVQTVLRHYCKECSK